MIKTVKNEGLREQIEYQFDVCDISSEEEIELINLIEHSSPDAQIKKMKEWAIKVLEGYNLPTHTNYVRYFDDGHWEPLPPNWQKHYAIKNTKNIGGEIIANVLYIVRNKPQSIEYKAAYLLEHINRLKKSILEDKTKDVLYHSLKCSDIYIKAFFLINFEKFTLSGKKYTEHGKDANAEKSWYCTTRNKKIRRHADNIRKRNPNVKKCKIAEIINKDEKFWQENDYTKISQETIRKII